MNQHEKLNYVEFSASNLIATKSFFSQVFNWSFEDYGPDYSAFSGEGLDGGFFKAEQSSSTKNGAALLIFYSNNLETTLAKVENAGGKIVKPIFHSRVVSGFILQNQVAMNSQFGQTPVYNSPKPK